MNDFPVFFTGNVPFPVGADDQGFGLVFGAWQDLIINQFGGYHVTVDGTSQALRNVVRLTVTAYFDAKGARGTESTGEGTDADDYAYSFSRLAFKG
jgi:hypothetical protein